MAVSLPTPCSSQVDPYRKGGRSQPSTQMPYTGKNIFHLWTRSSEEHLKLLEESIVCVIIFLAVVCEYIWSKSWKTGLCFAPRDWRSVVKEEAEIQNASLCNICRRPPTVKLGIFLGLESELGHGKSTLVCLIEISDYISVQGKSEGAQKAERARQDDLF